MTSHEGIVATLQDHRWQGSCPEQDLPHARDRHCRACRTLDSLLKVVAAADAIASPAYSWEEGPYAEGIHAGDAERLTFAVRRLQEVSSC